MNFNKFPFGLPEKERDGIQVTRILRRSFELQAQNNVSNACGFVNIILMRCFEASEIEVQSVYGTVDLCGLQMPHVWLRIHDHIVDNTYCEDIPTDMFIMMKEGAKYGDEIRESQLYLGDQVTQNAGIDDHNIRIFQWMLRPENSQKCLHLLKNKIQLRRYFEEMCIFMKKQFGIDIPEVTYKKCWACEKIGDDFKVCGKCKIAKYCSRNCQRNDWKQLHKEICLAPNSW
ncbi:hypothetical protein FSP39_015179 [Pinctada imbricata]|uniref:MYND-type domain-containing protein n=1 Tax=Pinctada imbricata TaxID=66713 RepID=A0AA89C8Y2_PINIB|nr:hypothetical protein FSP39_015179 [Pinctada imbricata]